MDQTTKRNLWHALLGGKSVDDSIEAELKGHRLDLSGLVVPQAEVLERYAVTPLTTVERVSRVVKAAGLILEHIDLSQARLNNVNFLDCSISDCVFDGASLRSCSFWNCIISKCSFRKTDLRDAVLGPTKDAQRNRFDQVDFSLADLRNTIYISADFRSCTFRHAKLTKVEFDGSSFTKGIFEGGLEEVTFARESTNTLGKHLPPNDMANVDFSSAQLFWVTFRGLNLDKVKFPEDKEHIILEDYPRELDRLLKFLVNRSDSDSKALATYIRHQRKWTGPKQKRGVLNKKEIVEIGGKELLDVVLQVVQPGRAAQT
jgi:uncharacterized protein YjbI with pentapeptide repeats